MNSMFKLVSMLVLVGSIATVFGYMVMENKRFQDLESNVRKQIQREIEIKLLETHRNPELMTITSVFQKQSDLELEEYEVQFRTNGQMYNQNFRGLFRFRYGRLDEYRIREQAGSETRFFMPTIVPMIPAIYQMYEKPAIVQNTPQSQSQPRQAVINTQSPFLKKQMENQKKIFPDEVLTADVYRPSQQRNMVKLVSQQSDYDSQMDDVFKQVDKLAEELENRQSSMFDKGSLSMFDEFMKTDSSEFFKDSYKRMEMFDKQFNELNKRLNDGSEIFGSKEFDEIFRSGFKLSQITPFFPEFNTFPSLDFYKNLQEYKDLIYKGPNQTPQKALEKISSKAFKEKKLKLVKTIYDDKFQLNKDENAYILVQEYKDKDEQKGLFEVLLVQKDEQNVLEIKDMKQISDEQIKKIRDQQKEKVEIKKKVDDIVDELRKQAQQQIQDGDVLQFSNFANVRCDGNDCQMVMKFSKQNQKYNKQIEQNLQDNKQIEQGKDDKQQKIKNMDYKIQVIENNSDKNYEMQIGQTNGDMNYEMQIVEDKNNMKDNDDILEPVNYWGVDSDNQYFDVYYTNKDGKLQVKSVNRVDRNDELFKQVSRSV